MNRMRTFLSWKDVRKNVKDDKVVQPEEDISEEGGMSLFVVNGLITMG